MCSTAMNPCAAWASDTELDTPPPCPEPDVSCVYPLRFNAIYFMSVEYYYY